MKITQNKTIFFLGLGYVIFVNYLKSYLDVFGSFPTGFREQYIRCLDLNLESLNAILAHPPDFAERVLLVNKVDRILRKLRAVEKKNSINNFSFYRFVPD